MAREHDWRQEPRRDRPSSRGDVTPQYSSLDDTTGVKNVRPVSNSGGTSGEIFDVDDFAEDFDGDVRKTRSDSRAPEPQGLAKSQDSATNLKPNRWLAFSTQEDDIRLSPFSGEDCGAQLVEPISGTGGRNLWRDVSNPKFVGHGLQCPKVAGACEDSPPIFITPRGRSTESTYLGVFDGMGGAGAGQVTFSLDNQMPQSTTEALLASRICWRAAMSWIVNSDLRHRDDLRKEISSLLKSATNKTSLSEGSRIRGTLTKRLPTTMVLSQVQPLTSDDRFNITTWWAGDSRAYLLTPEHGLAAITRDHVRESDQLEQLRSDPPIENVVNQSTDFYLEETIQEVSGPFVLLLATDGVFGYLPTPGFLELGLLEALSNRSQEVSNKFATFCTTYAADDVSAVMVVSGFQDDRDVTDRFRVRLATLRNQYSQILAMNPEDPNWNTEVERLWGLERPTYQRLLGGSID